MNPNYPGSTQGQMPPTGYGAPGMNPGQMRPPGPGPMNNPGKTFSLYFIHIQTRPSESPWR